jgi:hypothetical protein
VSQHAGIEWRPRHNSMPIRGAHLTGSFARVGATLTN